MTLTALREQTCNVLVVGGSVPRARFAEFSRAHIGGAGISLEHADGLSAALERLAQGGVDVVLVNLSRCDANGIDAYRAIRSRACAVPIVVIADLEEKSSVVELLKQGAQDYLLIDELEPALLARSVRYAMDRQRATALESVNLQLQEANQSLKRAMGQLEQKNEELIQFTSFASHDLQEPVRKIGYFVAQLREDLGGNLGEQASKDVQFLTEAARRMQALVKSLLALCHVGQATMQCESVDLALCVRQALDCLGEQIMATGAIVAHCPLPVVMGDSTLLTQLYQNLFSNALKFNRETPPRIELTAVPSGANWILGVRDNGIGIDPRFAESVFDPFQRLHGRGQYEGSGIGLAICKKVVERHDGQIWVQSKLGAGAHFEFIISAGPGPGSEPDRQAVASPDANDQFPHMARTIKHE